MWIIGLEITYGQALAPPGYHRVTNLQGVAAEISNQTYLWYKPHTSNPPISTPPILSLQIGNVIMDEYHALDKPIIQKTEAGESILLSYSTRNEGKSTLPIKELHIISDNDESLPSDFEWVPNLNENELLIGRLCLKRATQIEMDAYNAQEDPNSDTYLHKYTVGMWLDLYDILTNSWRPAQIKVNTAITSIRNFPPNALILLLPQYRSPHKETIVLAAQIQTRIAACGTNSNIFESPAYPMMRASSMRRLLCAADIDAIRSTLDESFFDMEETYFKSCLVPFIETCMAAPCREIDAAISMQKFLHHCLKYWVAAVVGSTIPCEMVYLIVAILRLIGNGHETCSVYYLPDAHAVSWERAEDMEHVRYLDRANGNGYRTAPCRSLYFVENIEYFFQAGGLRAMLVRTEAPDHVPLGELETYLVILSHVKPILTPTEDDLEILMLFFHAAFDRINLTTPKQLQDDHEGLIESLLSYMEELTTFWVDSDGAFAERIELTRVNISYQYLCCPSLTHQLIGMNQLLEWVDKSQKLDDAIHAHEKTTRQSQKQPPIIRKRIGSFQRLSSMITGSSISSDKSKSTEIPTEAAKWLRGAVFANWLVQAKVLDLILGDPSALSAIHLREAHMEVWKRCTPLLLLVSQHSLLTETHLTLLWHLARKQVARKKVVYDILLQLASSMMVPLLDAIANLLQQIPLDDYDELTVHFLTRITRLANGKAHQARLSAVDVDTLDKVAAMGVGFLWTAIQSQEHPLHRKFIKSFSTLLHEMNAIEAIHRRRNTRDYYVQLCIQGLAASSTLLPIDLALTVLHDIVESYVPEPIDLSHIASGVVASAMKNAVKEHPQDPFIQALDSKFQLLQMVVDIQPTCSSPCLEFLTYMLTNSGLVLDIKQFHQLYSQNEHCSEYFFKWLLTVLPDCLKNSKQIVFPDGFVGNGGFSPSNLEAIFSYTSNVITMGLYQFKCFEKLFRFLNGKTRKIGTAHVSTGFTIEYPLDQLVGYKNILEIATKCSDIIVTELAQQYVVYILLHLTGKQLNRKEIWLAFVKWCDGEIKASTSNEESTEYLKLLGMFLYHSKPHQTPYTRSEMEDLMVYIKTQDGRTSAPLNYTIPRSCTVGELRDRIAIDVGHFAEGIRIFTSTKQKLTVQLHDGLSIDEANIFDRIGNRKSYIEVILLKRAEPDTMGHKKTSLLTSKWMSTTDTTADWNMISKWLGTNSFSYYFSLLEDERICEPVWRVLVRLPHEIESTTTLKPYQTIPQVIYYLQNRHVTLTSDEAQHLRRILLSYDTKPELPTKTVLMWFGWTRIFDYLEQAMHQEMDWNEQGTSMWATTLSTTLRIASAIMNEKPATNSTRVVEKPMYAVPPLLEGTEQEIWDKAVIHVISFIYQILVTYESTCNSFIQDQNSVFVLLHALEVESPNVRAEAAKAIRSLCNPALSTLSFHVVYPFFLNYLSSYSNEIKHSDILYLYGDIVAKNPLPESFDKKDAMQRLLTRLEELIVTDENGDHIIEGLLHTMLSILEQIPHTSSNFVDNLIQELFHRCLFPTYNTTSAKCRSTSSRSIAFQLLQLCAKEREKFQLVLAMMEKQHAFEIKPKRKEWTKTIPSPKINTQLVRGQYVGLKNLGCTCYFNSIVQMGFIFPSFRELILSAHCKDKTSVLYQLQSLYAHLKCTSRPYINPAALLAVLKTNTGGAIDIKLQQDASEFLTSFLQQLESEINGTQHHIEKQFHRALSGIFSNELVADGGRYSERPESFHYISVPVRDRKTLEESLDGWVEGDMVSYTWDDEEDEKQTLDTQKRISIQTLPECLIIHLKRFEFDFETMQQVKVHDRFEFPMSLNMQRYTKEGQKSIRNGRLNDAVNDGIEWRAPEYYQYDLCGTIVHMGSAHSGHYYSYLKDPTSVEKWFEFNDTIVSPFDSNELPQECFGGTEEIHGLGQRVKNRSALMLVYNRRKPVLNPVASIQRIKNSFSCVGMIILAMIRLKRSIRQRNPLTISIHPSISNAIEAENRTFWRKQYVADVACMAYTYDLLHERDIGQVDALALKFSLKFLFGTLWQCRQVARILEWKEFILKIIPQCTKGMIWWLNALAQEPNLLADILVFHDQFEIQEFVADIIVLSIENTEWNSCKPAIAELLKHFPYISACEESYLRILLIYAEKGYEACEYLVVQEVVGNLVGLMIDLPMDERDSKVDTNIISPAFKVPPLSTRKFEVGKMVMLLLSKLLRCCDSPQRDTGVASSVPRVTLSQKECAILTCHEWINYLTHCATSFTPEGQVLTIIITSLCFESRSFSSIWLNILMDAIESKDHHEVKPYFRTLQLILSIDDSLANERLVDSMTKLIAIMASQQKYFKATEISIDMLLRIAKRNSKVCTWLHENKQSWAWTEKWLLSHRGVDGFLQSQKTLMVKPNSSSPWSEVDIMMPALVKNIEKSIIKFVPRLRVLFDKTSFQEELYDSDDDPSQLIGRRVKVKWAREKWYTGSVHSYNPTSGEHLVLYDDGDKKNYKLADKIFAYLE